MARAGHKIPQLHTMGLDLSHIAPRWVRLSRLFAAQKHRLAENIE